MSGKVDLGAIFASIKLDLSGLLVGKERAVREIQNMGSQISNLTDKNNDRLRTSVRETGTILSGIGLAAGFAVGVMTRESANFERGMRNVNSISKLTETQLAGIGEEVKKTAVEIGKAPVDLASGLYDIASSGFQGAQGVTVLNASAVAAKAGLASTAESAKGLVAVLNAYGYGAERATYVSDVLFRTVDRGVITFPELSQEIGTVVAASSAAGIGIEEVGAAIATMTKAGINAAETTTSLTRIIVAFLNPTKELETAIHAAGYESGEALLHAVGLAGAVEFLSRATNGSATALAELGMDARALRAAMSLSRQEGKAFAEDLAAMENASGATARAFQEQSKALTAEWEKATATGKVAAINLAQGLLPVLRSITSEVAAVTKEFSQMPQGVQTAIASGLALTAVVGTLGGGLLILVSQIAGLVASLGAAGIGLGAILTPVGEVLAIIAALGLVVWGAVKAYKALTVSASETAHAATVAAQKNLEDADATRRLVAEYEALRDKKQKTKQETVRLHAVLEQIARLNPELISGWDAQGKSIDLNSQKVAQLTAEYDKLRRAAFSAAISESVTKQQAAESNKTRLQGELRNEAKKLQPGALEGTSFQSGPGGAYHYLQTPDKKQALSKIDQIKLAIARENEAIAAEQKARQALTHPQESLAPAPVTRTPGAGGGRPTFSAATSGSSADEKKTPSELSDEAARNAMDWMGRQRVLNKDFTVQTQIAALDKVLQKQGQYSAMSQSMEAQVVSEKKRLMDELQNKKESDAAKALQIAKAQGDAEIALARAEGRDEDAIRMESAKREQDLLAAGVDAAKAKVLAQKELESNLEAFRTQRDERNRDAANRERQEDLRKLEYEFEHNRISTADYIAALEEKQSALKQYTDAWYEIQRQIEGVNADEVESVIADAEAIADKHREAAIEMLEAWRAAYVVMGDDGVAAVAKLDAALTKLNEKGAGEQGFSWGKSFQDMLSDIRMQSTDIFVGLIEGTTTFKEALADIGHQILRFLVNGLIEAALTGKNVFAGLSQGVGNLFSSITGSISMNLVQLAGQAMGVMAIFGKSGKRRSRGLFGGLLTGIIGAATGLFPVTMGNILTGAGLFAGFDDPHNDAVAQKWGGDFGVLFAKGADAALAATFPKHPGYVRGGQSNPGGTQITVTTNVDKVQGIEDIERIAETTAWIVQRNLQLA